MFRGACFTTQKQPREGKGNRIEGYGDTLVGDNQRDRGSGGDTEV